MDTLSPHVDDGNPSQKRCSRCKRELPMTTEYFIYKPAYRGRKARFTSECRDCKAKRDNVYSANHREERKRYRDSRKEEDRLYMIDWRQAHHEDQKAYDAKYKAEHREQASKQHKIYCAQYYKTERGRLQMRVSSSNRRARKREAEGTYTLEELYEQYDRQKHKCYYCHKRLGKDRNSWVAEHVIPLSRGGSNSIDNIVIACPDCNLKKGAKLPHEWGDGGRLL